MQKTILLTRYELGPKVTKFLFFMFGIGQSLQGIRYLVRDTSTNGDVFFGGFQLIVGLLLILLGFTLFNSRVTFSPKISVDEEKIIVREDIFTKTKRINWNDVKEITFKSFALDILLKNNKEELVILRTNAEVSIEVKALLREVANKKMIQVKGG